MRGKESVRSDKMRMKKRRRKGSSLEPWQEEEKVRSIRRKRNAGLF